MNQLFYIRFYSPRGNYMERVLWTVKDEADARKQAEEYADGELRIETILHVCSTKETVGMDI
jgi:hypothetical protein